jgi:hypothetical protein
MARPSKQSRQRLRSDNLRQEIDRIGLCRASFSVPINAVVEGLHRRSFSSPPQHPPHVEALSELFLASHPSMVGFRADQFLVCDIELRIIEGLAHRFLQNPYTIARGLRREEKRRSDQTERNWTEPYNRARPVQFLCFFKFFSGSAGIGNELLFS